MIVDYCGEPEWLTLREASERGYGSVQSLRAYIREGRLPASRLGRRFLVTIDDLQSLITPVQVVSQ